MNPTVRNLFAGPVQVAAGFLGLFTLAGFPQVDTFVYERSLTAEEAEQRASGPHAEHNAERACGACRPRLRREHRDLHRARREGPMIPTLFLFGLLFGRWWKTALLVGTAGWLVILWSNPATRTADPGIAVAFALGNTEWASLRISRCACCGISSRSLAKVSDRSAAALSPQFITMGTASPASLIAA